VIAEGVGSIVEHGGGRLLIPFYDLPWVPGLNEKELGEVREKLISLYGKDWSELMPETEVERSLYNAYTTEWGGKIPKEKEFNEWKEKQIELYGKAAEMSKNIAAILENKELSDEQKRAEIEKVLATDKEVMDKFLDILDNQQGGIKGSVDAYTSFFVSQEMPEKDARIRAISNVITIKKDEQYQISPDTIHQLDNIADYYESSVSSLDFKTIKTCILAGYCATVLVQSEQKKWMVSVMQQEK
jgi:hypothetical protein